jgi:hypothetical protein
MHIYILAWTYKISSYYIFICDLYKKDKNVKTINISNAYLEPHFCYFVCSKLQRSF